MGVLRKHPAVFLGLFIMLLFFVLNAVRVEFLDALDNKLYDITMNIRGDFEAPSDVVLVEVDEESIKRLGRWPWPRTILAEGIDIIGQGQPKVIGLNVILSEAQTTDSVEILEALKEMFSTAFGNVQDPELKERAGVFMQSMNEAQQALDFDGALASAMEMAGNVVLPVYYSMSDAVPPPDEPNEALYPLAMSLEIPDGTLVPYPASEIILPVDQFLYACIGIGHINVSPDPDGVVRREVLYFNGGGVNEVLPIPSYTVSLLWHYLGAGQDEATAALGYGLSIKGREIPTLADGSIMVSYKGPPGAFQSYSFFEVANGSVKPAVFKNKLVILTITAPGITDLLSTPTGDMTPGEFSANSIWTMLNSDFIQQPPWTGTAQLAFILIIGLLSALVLPRIKALFAALIFIVLLFGLAGGSFYMMTASGVWMPVMYAVIQLILSYIGAVTIQYFVSETGMEKAKGESAETNRMLGLSFQNQGMLDMAFDKFRRVPVDDEVKDLLYNLALDFERKRQFNKAASVYEYIEEHDQKFKDVATRKTKLMQASETMVFGPGVLGGGGVSDTLISEGSDTKPTLGRYEVSKMLGKGAMGIVYLGKDPRINRTTAIKTVRFSDDFQEEEAAKMKEKFFREAESAGTLSHPNIVTIYDAGEEQDLAYIAMEFLEGGDLEDHIKPDKLLPMRKVIGHMADICDALDYAHSKGIVHRDIKPANIMLLKTGVCKITDFGIARITATSQTQTGVVKGTPYYMSPEQIAGQKVDGRSDIFSVGVMTYQLLTGKLPFHGDSVAALMHQIMNVAHPDPRQFNPKIPKPLAAIINKALEKDREKRYQKAGQMASHLRQLGQRIDAMAAQKKEGGA
ncbi:serine/threonine protein kinase with Chase2 sensor [Desulfatibacillum aliphaticivorans]|uniref:non-specific serine/threonine protein kinase n=1 Tax=Desulfatibacillum aliphaticivorans TaxID=218208 RepID=B8FFA9_DESAL|nr:serine/threonine-protein kinase [Desulfatibacillum aliphaticivorans]ACL04169.1 serine/threonine protein kinase with Chase2 sensor [Desulfatibacillum aliphaticivorans]